MSGGFGNVQGALTEQQKDDAGRNDAFIYEVWPLYPGEVMTARFYGGKGEPYTYRKHGFSRGSEGGFPSAICTRAEHGSCEACGPASRRGEKRVKRASAVAVFKIFSTRIKLKIPETQADGSVKNKSEVLHVNENGQHLQKIVVKQGNVNVVTYSIYPGGKHPLAAALAAGQVAWEYEGPCLWRGSLASIANNADQILQLDKKLSRRCKCGAVVGEAHEKAPAMVVTIGNTCTNCQNAVAYNEDSRERREITVCPACHTGMIPTEKLGCTANCAAPARGALPDCYVRINRKGESVETRYGFDPMPFSKVSETHMSAMFPINKDSGLAEAPEFDYKAIYRSNPEEIRALLMARGIMPQGGTAFGGQQQGGGGFPQQGGAPQQAANPFLPGGGAQQHPAFAPPPGVPMPSAPPPVMGGFAPAVTAPAVPVPSAPPPPVAPPSSLKW